MFGVSDKLRQKLDDHITALRKREKEKINLNILDIHFLSELPYLNEGFIKGILCSLHRNARADQQEKVKYAFIAPSLSGKTKTALSLGAFTPVIMIPFKDKTHSLNKSVIDLYQNNRDKYFIPLITDLSGVRFTTKYDFSNQIKTILKEGKNSLKLLDLLFSISYYIETVVTAMILSSVCFYLEISNNFRDVSTTISVSEPKVASFEIYSYAVTNGGSILIKEMFKEIINDCNLTFFDAEKDYSLLKEQLHGQMAEIFSDISQLLGENENLPIAIAVDEIHMLAGIGHNLFVNTNLPKEDALEVLTTKFLNSTTHEYHREGDMLLILENVLEDITGENYGCFSVHSIFLSTLFSIWRTQFSLQSRGRQQLKSFCDFPTISKTDSVIKLLEKLFPKKREETYKALLTGARDFIGRPGLLAMLLKFANEEIEKSLDEEFDLKCVLQQFEKEFMAGMRKKLNELCNNTITNPRYSFVNSKDMIKHYTYCLVLRNGYLALNNNVKEEALTHGFASTVKNYSLGESYDVWVLEPIIKRFFLSFEDRFTLARDLILGNYGSNPQYDGFLLEEAISLQLLQHKYTTLRDWVICCGTLSDPEYAPCLEDMQLFDYQYAGRTGDSIELSTTQLYKYSKIVKKEAIIIGGAGVTFPDIQFLVRDTHLKTNVFVSIQVKNWSKKLTGKETILSSLKSLNPVNFVGSYSKGVWKIDKEEYERLFSIATKTRYVRIIVSDHGFSGKVIAWVDDYNKIHGKSYPIILLERNANLYGKDFFDILKPHNVSHTDEPSNLKIDLLTLNLDIKKEEHDAMEDDE
ncbi:hypothetical protein ABK040_003173 [Willaertia magna]